MIECKTRTKSKLKCYDIPKDDFVPLLVITRAVLETPDEEVPTEVLEEVIKKVDRFKPQPRYVN